MNADHSEQSEFEHLLGKLSDQVLCQADVQRLGELLELNRDFRLKYLHYCQLHAILRSEHGLLTSWSATLDGPERNAGVWRWSFLSDRRVAAFLAAAALILVSLGLFTYNSMRERPPFRGNEMAQLSRAVGARFSYGTNGDFAVREGEKLRQGRYELLSGLVEIEYDSGAILLVRAPAAFELVDEALVRLEDGQISAHVPPSAIGFRVESPGATVIDMGTDFAVQAIKEKESEVHVFEGEVMVDLHGGMSRSADLLRLVTGEATRVDYLSGMPSGIDLDEGQFLRSLRDEASSYARTMLALNPAVYYRMEPIGDGTRLVDSSDNRADAIMHFGRSTNPVWTAGKVGTALTLGGPSQQCYAAATQYPQTDGNELTVAGWVCAQSRPRWASIAKNWAGGVEDRGQFHFGLFEDSGELEAHVVDESGTEIVVRDKLPFPLHTWQHVAFVADGSMLRLYRNGVEVDAKPYRQLHRDPRIKALGIGTKLNLEGDAPEERDFNMWDGRLDELAIFNHALSPAQITELCDQANSAN